jgi:hypothetical protein
MGVYIYSAALLLFNLIPLVFIFNSLGKIVLDIIWE